MRNSTLIRGTIFFIALVAVVSCAPKKRLVTVGEKNERRVSRAERTNILDNVVQRELYFTTFSGRAKSQIVINKDNYDVTANVRIERDKAIWISVTALMGIEAGRVLITPDSVQIINRLQSEYMKKPFDYLHNFTSDELDFSNLQRLLIGNVIKQAVGHDTEVWAIDGNHLLRGQINNLMYAVQVDASYRTMSNSLNEVARRQRLEAHYANYQESGQLTFPYQVNISVTAEGLKLQSAMNYTRVAYDEVLSMPFDIPSRYKEIQ
ncbi:DUF4292 domain-containing protein [Parapedobacter koreensis]|uniref:DUF4292 domain-containing protein n=1 Tax=Parapedobacter koreensis TaxID=332977 RepID=A0A1H7RG75_9SPHI|nr:DUF4292 domain-containing protein [Parapedobacter koreensis]SEL58854.1 protein of unknown function [Parapedobacter koreensis]